MAEYLIEWVKTIDIHNVNPKTTFIDNDDSLYITFNYTDVLETVYRVDPEKIVHIHGSLQDFDDDPVLGHGNLTRINDIHGKRQEAEHLREEKWASACKAVENYYLRTFKNINDYLYKLNHLKRNDVDEIIVIGHSLSGVDLPYFSKIDTLTKQKANWKVFYFAKEGFANEEEKQLLFMNLTDCGVGAERIEMVPTTEFYNL